VVWLGGLAYVTYIGVIVAIQISFNELFLVYVALLSLSLFTLVGGVVTTDAEDIGRALEGRIDPSLYGGALVVVGLGLGATLAAPVGLTTPVLMSGSAITVSPVAAAFTFLPIVVSALLAVTYVFSMGGRRRPPVDEDRQQSA
jgi:hypothetical protein